MPANKLTAKQAKAAMEVIPQSIADATALIVHAEFTVLQFKRALLRNGLREAFLACAELGAIHVEHEFDLGEVSMVLDCDTLDGKRMYPTPQYVGEDYRLEKDWLKNAKEELDDNEDDNAVLCDSVDYLTALGCIARSGIFKAVDNRFRPDSKFSVFEMFPLVKRKNCVNFTLTRAQVLAEDFNPTTFVPSK